MPRSDTTALTQAPAIAPALNSVAIVSHTATQTVANIGNSIDRATQGQSAIYYRLKSNFCH